jgi:hypothetical protein
MCLVFSIAAYQKKSREGQGFFYRNQNLRHAIKSLNNTFFPPKNSKFEPDLWVFKIEKTNRSGWNLEFLGGKNVLFRDVILWGNIWAVLKIPSAFSAKILLSGKLFGEASAKI